ncbi:MAG: hypothetical protein ACRC3B_22875 [Bacteroidia bacterium]
MFRILLFSLILLVASCSSDDQFITGSWKLQQETTSTGAQLSAGNGTLIIDESGTYKMYDQDTASGRWYILKNRDTEQRALRLDAEEGVFSIYAVDTLTENKLVLRTGFGRRMVFVK